MGQWSNDACVGQAHLHAQHTHTHSHTHSHTHTTPKPDPTCTLTPEPSPPPPRTHTLSLTHTGFSGTACSDICGGVLHGRDLCAVGCCQGKNISLHVREDQGTKLGPLQVERHRCHRHKLHASCHTVPLMPPGPTHPPVVYTVDVVACCSGGKARVVALEGQWCGCAPRPSCVGTRMRKRRVVPCSPRRERTEDLAHNDSKDADVDDMTQPTTVDVLRCLWCRFDNVRGQGGFNSEWGFSPSLRQASARARTLTPTAPWAINVAVRKERWAGVHVERKLGCTQAVFARACVDTWAPPLGWAGPPPRRWRRACVRAVVAVGVHGVCARSRTVLLAVFR